MAVDDRVRRNLREIPPADPAGAYERIVGKKLRRGFVRTTGRIVLACAVVAGSASGFIALSKTFRPADRRVTPATAENGLIAFVRVDATATALGGHRISSSIYVFDPSDPQPRRIATIDGQALDLDWSPNGKRLLFGAHPATGDVVYVVNGDGTDLHRVIDHGWMPAWSPDGRRIAYTGGDDQIHVADEDGSNDVTLTHVSSAGYVDWSPDGSMLAFAGPGPENHRQGWDIYVMSADGSNVQNLTNHPAVDLDPSWSPDGSRILFRSRRAEPLGGVSEDESNERLYTIHPDGSALTELTTDTTITQSPTWSPDGSRIVFDDGGDLFVANADGSNIHEIGHGLQPAWQPVDIAPSGATGEPSQDPSAAGSARAGRDIGLGLRLCDLETLRHVDLLGDGSAGIAWTGAPVTDAGRCPRRTMNTYVVAVDLTGDGLADTASGPLEDCFMCRPYAATNLDWSDGADELIVLESGTTTPRFSFFDVRTGGTEPRLRPILVGAESSSENGFPEGDVLHITTGGDEGFSGFVGCKNHPAKPEIYVGWADGPVDGTGSDVRDAHFARLIVQSGEARVLDAEGFSVPVGDALPYPFGTNNVACGVDWNPFDNA